MAIGTADRGTQHTGAPKPRCRAERWPWSPSSVQVRNGAVPLGAEDVWAAAAIVLRDPDQVGAFWSGPRVHQDHRVSRKTRATSERSDVGDGRPARREGETPGQGGPSREPWRPKDSCRATGPGANHLARPDGSTRLISPRGPTPRPRPSTEFRGPPCHRRRSRPSDF